VFVFDVCLSAFHYVLRMAKTSKKMVPAKK